MTKGEFVKKVERVRSVNIKAQTLEDTLFEELEMVFNGIDLEEVESKAYNAENAKHAIMYYLHYGEYDPVRIWDEIMEATR